MAAKVGVIKHRTRERRPPPLKPGRMLISTACQMALVAKNSPANAGDIRDMGWIPGSRRPLGEGNGNPLQYSCLKNSMDRGALRAIIHRVARVDMTEAT